MANSPKKKRTRSLTDKQRKALTHIAVNGGKISDALRAAGYSPSSVKNPHKFTRSSGFAKALETAGISDAKVAKRYSRLLNSSRIDHHTFEGWIEKRKWQYPSEEKIRIMIEGTEDNPTGCEVMFIDTDTKYHRRMVTYRHPDNAAQTRIIELIGKVKEHFAPEKLAVVEHELDETERKFLSGLNGE